MFGSMLSRLRARLWPTYGPSWSNYDDLFGRWSESERVPIKSRYSLLEAIHDATGTAYRASQGVPDHHLELGIRRFEDQIRSNGFEEFLVNYPVPDGLDLILDPLISIRRLSIGANARILIQSASMQRIEIESSGVELSLRDSRVGRLSIEKDSQSIVRIGVAHIAMLELGEHSIADLEVRNSSVQRIECPPPNQTSPFTGSVVLSDVFLPVTNRGSAKVDAQSYRNLRHHLAEMDNTEAADLVHVAQQMVERKGYGLISKAISIGYGWASKCGTSPGTAVARIAGIWLLGTLVLLWSGGAVAALPRGQYIGWEQSLWGPSDSATYVRATLLSLQSLVNPAGILPRSELLIASSFPIRVYLALQGLASTALIALFLLAVRRKFRIR